MQVERDSKTTQSGTSRRSRQRQDHRGASSRVPAGSRAQKRPSGARESFRARRKSTTCCAKCSSSPPSPVWTCSGSSPRPPSRRISTRVAHQSRARRELPQPGLLLRRLSRLSRIVNVSNLEVDAKQDPSIASTILATAPPPPSCSSSGAAAPARPRPGAPGPHRAPRRREVIWVRGFLSNEERRL
jgi:hypothetical protein